MIIAVCAFWAMALYLVIRLYIAYRKSLPEVEELLVNYGYDHNDNKKLARKLAKKIIMVGVVANDKEEFEKEVDSLLEPFIDPTKK